MADFVRPSFKELSAVSLTRPINAQGVAVPAGARGVVMAAYADGLAYEVEFEEPHVVLTVEGEDLRG
jgi:hypothetical protein